MLSIKNIFPRSCIDIFHFLLCTILFLSTPFAQAAKKRKPSSVKSAIEENQVAPGSYSKWTLETVQKKQISGIDQLKNKKEINSFLRDANIYSSFKKKGMSSLKRIALQNQCDKDPDHNYFCIWIRTPKSSKGLETSDLITPSLGPNENAPPVSNSRVILEELKEKNFDKLIQYTEQEVHRAFRSVSDSAEIIGIARGLASKSTCLSPGGHSALGLKLEETFPNQEAIQLAIRNYEKAISCPKTSLKNEADSIQKARFRLGLLFTWQKNYKAALAVLKPSVSDKENEFHSRALFWAANAAKELEDEDLATEYRNQLNFLYPLSYHNLIEISSHPELVLKNAELALHKKDVYVKLRSEGRPDFNFRIQAVEALLKNREFGLATELLYDQLDLFSVLEPEVRLYIALLFERAGDRIGKFRILADLFRQDISWMSESTLKLFYPYPSEVASLLKKHSKLSKTADEILIAALIRQESGFNVRARSPAGALGLMQLMPGTARQMERVSRADLYKPSVNVRLGIRYFTDLLRKYEGNAELALAAYNAGSHRVQDWQMRYPTEDRVLFMDFIPFRETRDYVALIARNYYWYSRLYNIGHFAIADANGDRSTASSANTRVAETAKRETNSSHLLGFTKSLFALSEKIKKEQN